MSNFDLSKLTFEESINYLRVNGFKKAFDDIGEKSKVLTILNKVVIIENNYKIIVIYNEQKSFEHRKIKNKKKLMRYNDLLYYIYYFSDKNKLISHYRGEIMNDNIVVLAYDEEKVMNLDDISYLNYNILSDTNKNDSEIISKKLHYLPNIKSKINYDDIDENNVNIKTLTAFDSTDLFKSVKLFNFNLDFLDNNFF